MTKSSVELKKIIEIYTTTFPNNWIKSLNWSNETVSKNSYTSGIAKIHSFEEDVFICLSRALLKGEFLLKTYEQIEDICNICQDEDCIDGDNNLSNKLHLKFAQLNNDLYEVVRVYRFKVENINDKFKLLQHNYIVNAISQSTQRFTYDLFNIFMIITNICIQEYELSYNEEHIKDFILYKDLLAKTEKRYTSQNIKNVISSVCLKIDFLLHKLSHLSYNNTIEYYLDFNKQSIDANANISENEELLNRFNYFMSPDKIPQECISVWQDKCYKKIARMWQMVLLMRYYTKVTKSRIQIENLIKQYDSFYIKMIPKTERVFDKYALRTVKNYMYNCRFSFYIKSNINYRNFNIELNNIIDIQDRTNIYNFYPYKKAASYMLNDIRTSINNGEGLKYIKEKKEFLDKILKNLIFTYKWCKNNQFYPFQLMYNECISSINKYKMVIFSPSSFTRPIKYDDLSDQIEKYKSDVNSIKNEIQIYEERLKIIELKNNIDKNRKTYIEIFSIFVTVTTFLVGCITIFTNVETPKVSLYDKIEHITLLGVLLLMFISSAYFLILDKKEYCNSPKFWFFSLTTVFYLLVLFKYLIH